MLPVTGPSEVEESYEKFKGREQLECRRIAGKLLLNLIFNLQGVRLWTGLK
jgi:hypothetical protein